MTQISLAKALKLKNRLAGRLAQEGANVRLYNSRLKEAPAEINVEEAFSIRSQLSQGLIDLKTKLYKANLGIQEKLYTLAEKKGDIEFLKTIPTKYGKERHDYQNTEVEYVAWLRKGEVDSKVRILEGEIDALQDEIDEYNVATKITVDQGILDLGS